MKMPALPYYRVDREITFAGYTMYFWSNLVYECAIKDIFEKDNTMRVGSCTYLEIDKNTDSMLDIFTTYKNYA